MKLNYLVSFLSLKYSMNLNIWFENLLKAEENVFLAGLMSGVGQTFMWIGIHDANEDDNLVTVDGTSLDWTKWGPNQPSHLNGRWSRRWRRNTKSITIFQHMEWPCEIPSKSICVHLCQIQLGTIRSEKINLKKSIYSIKYAFIDFIEHFLYLFNFYNINRIRPCILYAAYCILVYWLRSINHESWWLSLKSFKILSDDTKIFMIPWEPDIKNSFWNFPEYSLPIALLKNFLEVIDAAI